MFTRNVVTRGSRDDQKLIYFRAARIPFYQRRDRRGDLFNFSAENNSDGMMIK